jgi:hypothetical protein
MAEIIDEGFTAILTNPLAVPKLKNERMKV